MTPTIAIRRRTPAEIAARSQAVLHAALHFTLPEDQEARKAIGGAALDLDETLDAYRVIAGLSAETEPRPQALEKAAEETAFAKASLLNAIAVYCGTDVADELKSAAEGGR